ncbi:MAG: YcaO-like family protein [Candidatus Omnitrophota bacterium]
MLQLDMSSLHQFKQLCRQLKSCVMPPSDKEKTRLVLKRIKNLKKAILEGCFLRRHASGSFHCQAKGSLCYTAITGDFFTNGRGASRYQARIGCLMEMAERYSAFKHLIDPSKIIISSSGRFKNNPFSIESLMANSPDDPSFNLVSHKEFSGLRLGWHKCFDLDGLTAYLPLRMIADFLEGSNGMAAGFSLKEAILKGLLESIERDRAVRIRSGGLDTPLIEGKSIKDSRAKKLIRGFNLLGHHVFIRDFSLKLPIPVIGVARRVNCKDFLLTVSTGLTADEALIRALSENSQIEPGRFNFLKVRENPQYFRATPKINMRDIPDMNGGSVSRSLDILKDIINKSGMVAFFCDATDKELRMPVAITYIAAAKVNSQKEEGKDFLFGLIAELFRAGEDKAAGLFLKRAKQKDKERYLFYMGNKFIAEGRQIQALGYFRRLLKKSSIDRFKEVSLYWLGLDALSRKDNRKALNYFSALVKQRPGSFYPAFLTSACRHKAFANAQQLYLKLWLADNSSYLKKENLAI